MTKLLEQTIAYNLGAGGVDQKTNEVFAPLGRPRELANVRFPKTGSIAKRFGLVPATDQEAVDIGVTLDRIIAAGNALLGFGGAIANTNDVRRRQAYCRIQSADQLPRSGILKTVRPSDSATVGDGSSPVPRAWVDDIYSGTISGSGDIEAVDSAVGLTQTCYVYRVNSGGIYCLIVDNETGVVVSRDTAISTTANEIGRVVAVPNSNVFVAAAGGVTSGLLTIKLVQANTNPLVTSLTVVASDTSLSINANGEWDWALFGSTLVIAYRTAAATTVTVSKFTISSSALGSPTSGTPVAMVTGPTKVAIAVPYSSTADACILAYEATNGIRGFTVSTSSLAVVQSLWVVSATLTTRNKLTGAISATGKLWTYSEINNAADYLVNVQRTVGTIGGAGTANTVCPGASSYLGSKPIFTSASDYPFVVLHHLSKTGSSYGLQHGLYLYDGFIVAAMFLRGDVPLPLTVSSVTGLPSIVSQKADTSLTGSPVVEFQCPTIRAKDLQVDQSGAFRSSVVSALRFNVHPSSGLAAVRDGRATLIQGGFLASFDGSSLVENGFLQYPEIISATPSNGAGSLPSSGTFDFVACFVATDANGVVHRSAPSEVLTATTGVGDDTFAVVVRGLCHTRRIIYDLELYRTEDDGSQFYLAAKTRNIPSTSTTVSFTVTGSDATLIASSPLGQQDGILDNEQPNCPIAIATTGKRILVVSGDNRFTVIEGKERIEGEGAAFFDGVSRRITQDGEIFALATIGERWAAFKKRRIFLASGDGAVDTGASDTLTEFEAHPISGVGCTNQRAMVETPIGIVFKSEKGFYLLNTGGGIDPIGVGIEDYKDFPVRGAAFNADRNEAIFLLVDGPRLVLSLHETEQGPGPRWSIDEDNDSAEAYGDIAVVDGQLYLSAEERHAGDPYSLVVEDVGGYADQPAGVVSLGGAAENVPDGYPVVMRVTTGWIPLAGLQQGRARLRSAKFLGKVKSVHTARIRAAYDYVDQWVDDKTVTSANATNGGQSAYQWEFRPSEQRHSAVKLEFTEVLTSAGEGLELNQILLSVGIEPGTKRLRSTQRAT